MTDLMAKKPWPAMSLAQAHAALTAPGSPFETSEALVDGRKMRVWKNAPATIRDVFVHSRANFGPNTFLVYEDERASFEAFARAVLLMAEHLAALGVIKGDRVAVAMRNLPEWPVAVLATLLLGAITSPINAWGTGPELAYCLADSGAKVAVVDEELDVAAPHLGRSEVRDRQVRHRANGTKPAGSGVRGGAGWRGLASDLSARGASTGSTRQSPRPPTRPEPALE